jgi:hypothetical protein
MAERTGASQEIGTALLARGYRLFHWWHKVRDGTLSKELFRVCRIKAEPLSDKLFSHFEHD